jgi:hypothetical protein
VNPLGSESPAVRLDTLCGAPIEIARFLTIAARAAAAVAELHCCDVVHRSIQPHSFELDTATDEVRISEASEKDPRRARGSRWPTCRRSRPAA